MESLYGMGDGTNIAIFADLMGNATDIKVNGNVKYTPNAQNGLGAVYMNAAYTGTEFTTSKAGRNPEVFMAFRNVEYVAAGISFESRYNGYGFGTYGAGDGAIGIMSTSGAVMVQQDIDYSKWHVANIYFGDTDGFAIFDDEDLGLSFGIAGKYTTQSLTNVIFGFYPSSGHYAHQYVGEVLIFNEKLSESDRSMVTSYLMSKWDISSSSASTSCTESSIDKSTSVVSQLQSLTPPKCMRPAGTGLFFNGTNWICECVQNSTHVYHGESCENLLVPSPPPPSSLSPFYETVFPTCTLIGDTPPTILVPFGDYDGNGLLDVIELSEDKTKISVRLQTSARTFASETTILISGLSGEKVLRPESVGDFTNDGKEDIVLLGGGTTWGNNRGSGDVFYASNPSSWLPWTVSEQSNTKWGNRMATGDFNGDGWLDIVTNNIYFSDLNDVYTNTKGTASIGVQVNSLANTGTFSHDVTVGDMDGDSNLDLIFASSDGGGDYVIYGDGNGNFGDKWRFDGGSRGALVACDFDGDGRLDVATGDFYSALKVHYTAGASSYTRTSLFSSSSTVAEAGNRIYGMACADVNHDGWTDLIVSGAKVSVFINQGYKGESNYIVKDGQQVIFDPNPAWASPHMTLKDMDGDGSLDLVTPWHICWNNAGN
jgi:hypothetical protein